MFRWTAGTAARAVCFRKGAAPDAAVHRPPPSLLGRGPRLRPSPREPCTPPQPQPPSVVEVSDGGSSTTATRDEASPDVRAPPPPSPSTGTATRANGALLARLAARQEAADAPKRMAVETFAALRRRERRERHAARLRQRDVNRYLCMAPRPPPAEPAAAAIRVVRRLRRLRVDSHAAAGAAPSRPPATAADARAASGGGRRWRGGGFSLQPAVAFLLPPPGRQQPWPLRRGAHARGPLSARGGGGGE
ncbi:hypothetical protein STCU_12065 [Strigomonas culicis]|uniref:Uncharacterized protein n=1 Tax=Strigomonas culicis TaxID=28005 RepID=S9UXW8_9TRYP|nr:hypothetical protein STCU_12065 [Strigomonas culicis]|eukprot:EPY15390.1 hypothetical protein STCU_12065 [Strigomonas culicis]